MALFSNKKRKSIFGSYRADGWSPTTPLFDEESSLLENQFDNQLRREQNLGARLLAAGVEPPAPEQKTGWLEKTLTVLGALDKPRNAVFNAIEDVATGENGFWQGLKEGWTQEEEVTGADVLGRMGVSNKWGRGLGGFAIDVLGDPLSWVTFGAGGFLKGAVTGAGKTLGREAAEAALRSGAAKALGFEDELIKNVSDRTLRKALLDVTDDTAYNVIQEKLVPKALELIQHGPKKGLSLLKKEIPSLLKEAGASHLTGTINPEKVWDYALNYVDVDSVLDVLPELTDDFVRKTVRAASKEEKDALISLLQKKSQYGSGPGLGIYAPFTQKGFTLIDGARLQDMGAALNRQLLGKLRNGNVLGQAAADVVGGFSTAMNRLFNPKGKLAELGQVGDLVYNLIRIKNGTANSEIVRDVDNILNTIKDASPEDLNAVRYYLEGGLRDAAAAQKAVEAGLAEIVSHSSLDAKTKELLKKGQIPNNLYEIDKKQGLFVQLQPLTKKQQQLFAAFDEMRNKYADIEEALGLLKDRLPDYVPHTLSWELRGDGQGPLRRFFSGRTRNLAVQHFPSYKRQHQGSIDAVNAILQERYDVPVVEENIAKAFIDRTIDHHNAVQERLLLDRILHAVGKKGGAGATESGYINVIPRSALTAYKMGKFDNAMLRNAYKKAQDTLREGMQYLNRRGETEQKLTALDELVKQRENGTIVEPDLVHNISLGGKNGFVRAVFPDEIHARLYKYAAASARLASKAKKGKEIAEEELQALAAERNALAEQLKIKPADLEKRAQEYFDYVRNSKTKVEKGHALKLDTFEGKAVPEAIRIDADAINSMRKFRIKKETAEKEIQDILQGLKDTTALDKETFNKVKQALRWQLLSPADKSAFRPVSKEAASALKRLLENTSDALIAISPEDQKTLAVHGIDLDVWGIPRQVYDALIKPGGKKQDEGMSLLGQAVDTFYKIWKPTVTGMNPIHHIRNFTGAQWQNFLDIGFKVLDPRIQKAAAKIVSGAKGEIELGGKKYTFDEIRDAVQKHNVETTFLKTDTTSLEEALRDKAGHEIDYMKKSKLAKVAEKNPLSLWAKAGIHVGNQIERQVRLVNFLAHLDNGADFKQAAQQAIKYHFDYTELTPAEKQLLRRAMPFYTWKRKNVPLQIESFLNDPRKYTAVYKLLNNMAAADDKDLSNLPDWLMAQLPIPLPGKTEDNRDRYIGLSLPYTDILDMGPETFWNSLSPLAKVPLELYTNQSLLTGAPIERYPDEQTTLMGIEMNKRLAHALQQFGVFRDIAKGLQNDAPRETTEVYTPYPMLPIVKDYSPEAGALNAQFNRVRQLENYVQKLVNEGTPVPTLREIPALQREQLKYRYKQSYME